MDKVDEASLEIRFADLYGNMLDKSNNKVLRDYLADSYTCRMIAHKNIRCLLGTVKNTEESKDSDSLIYSSCFLLAFEGSYVRTIDSIIYLLVLDGHDLFDPLRERYVHFPDEINRIDISVKFKFLKEHRFEILIRQEDSELRNKIAHHDFRISDRQKITIKGTEYELKKRLESLLGFVRDISKPYVDALRKESELRGIFPSES